MPRPPVTIAKLPLTPRGLVGRLRVLSYPSEDGVACRHQTPSLRLGFRHLPESSVGLELLRSLTIAASAGAMKL